MIVSSVSSISFLFMLLDRMVWPLCDSHTRTANPFVASLCRVQYSIVLSVQFCRLQSNEKF